MPTEPHLKFGVFIPPLHRVGQNPTLALERDLDLVVLLDRLGFDEAWVGEHHSTGWEIIASPEVFIAVAAERTRRIKLGTGVSSVPYHHPLMLADRMVLLDHLTRGRVMLGVGPGALPSDAHMMGIDPSTQRRRLEEGFDAICRLLRDDEPVTMETDWFTLRDARLQLAPYSNPCFDLAVAAVRSPSGPRIAGRFGVGVISIGATEPGNFTFVGDTWALCEEMAAQHGQTVRRDDWRLVGSFHVAPTMSQALEEVRFGYADRMRYMLGVSPFGNDVGDVDAAVASVDLDALAESGTGGFGTPEMARQQVQALWDKSGGFGTFLLSLSEVADPQATRRSLELFAAEVMPEFQGSTRKPRESWEWTWDRKERFRGEFRQAQNQMIDQHATEQERRASAP